MLNTTNARLGELSISVLNGWAKRIINTLSRQSLAFACPNTLQSTILLSSPPQKFSIEPILATILWVLHLKEEYEMQLLAPASDVLVCFTHCFWYKVLPKIKLLWMRLAPAYQFLSGLSTICRNTCALCSSNLFSRVTPCRMLRVGEINGKRPKR